MAAISQRATEISYRVSDHTSQVTPPVQNGPPTRPIYRVSQHSQRRSKRGALVDRGANGGILGNDAHVILTHQREVDVTGIDNHEVTGLKIVDASAKVNTQHGDIIIIMRQYAYHGTGRTIHSSGQLESYKNKVDDRSWKVEGRQCIKTLDGYLIPLDIINGLPYMKMVPNTDHEFQTLPHVILTSEQDWDPKILDNVISDQDDWYNVIQDWDNGLIKTPFDEFGNYRKREPVKRARTSLGL